MITHTTSWLRFYFFILFLQRDYLLLRIYLVYVIIIIIHFVYCELLRDVGLYGLPASTTYNFKVLSFHNIRIGNASNDEFNPILWSAAAKERKKERKRFAVIYGCVSET